MPRMSPLQLQRLKRSNLTELAMESLLKQIRAGVLRPGDPLPAERQLVAQLGLSRTAVREALRGMASIGVIEILPGKGAFVRSISPEALIDPESLFFILERETLLHALEAREILEVEVVALAAQRATPEDLAGLDRALDHMRRGLELGPRPLSHSPNFHLLLAEAAHNPVLTNMVKPFLRLMARGAEVIEDSVPEAKQREYELHAELYEAIVAHDPEAARQRMRKHLGEARGFILRAFPKEQLPQPPNGANAAPNGLEAVSL